MEAQPSPTPAAFVGYELIRRAGLLSARFTDALRPHGLTSRQFSALAVIDAGTTRSNAELARAIVMTPQSVGTLLEVLQQRGLIEKTDDALPRQSFQLTAAGRDSLSAAYVTVQRLDGEVRGALGADYQHLARILNDWPS